MAVSTLNAKLTCQLSKKNYWLPKTDKNCPSAKSSNTLTLSSKNAQENPSLSMVFPWNGKTLTAGFKPTGHPSSSISEPMRKNSSKEAGRKPEKKQEEKSVNKISTNSKTFWPKMPNGPINSAQDAPTLLSIKSISLLNLSWLKS